MRQSNTCEENQNGENGNIFLTNPKIPQRYRVGTAKKFINGSKVILYSRVCSSQCFVFLGNQITTQKLSIMIYYYSCVYSQLVLFSGILFWYQSSSPILHMTNPMLLIAFFLILEYYTLYETDPINYNFSSFSNIRYSSTKQHNKSNNFTNIHISQLNLYPEIIVHTYRCYNNLQML